MEKTIEKRTADAKTIINLLQEELNIPNIKSSRRTRDLVQARFIYFKLAKKFCRYNSLHAIGKAVGKDHASVIHGLKRFDVEAKYDPYMYDVYDKIYNKLDHNYVKASRNNKMDVTFERILERLEKVEIKLNKVLL